MTHESIMHNLFGALEIMDEFDLDNERFISFLPLSHSYERMAGLYFPILICAQIYFCSSMDKLLNEIKEIKPTILSAVPRLYENIFKKIKLQINKSNLLISFFLKIIFENLDSKKKHNLLESFLSKIFIKLILENKIKSIFGGKVKILVSGGAALNPEIGIFFNKLNLTLLQGYGQTEASPLISCNRKLSNKPETVGELILKLRSYAYLVYCTDQINSDKAKFYQYIEESVLDCQKDVIFYGIELNKLSDNKTLAFSKTKYKNWVKNHKKFKKYQKSENIERILAEKSLTSSSAWIRFFDQVMTRLKFRIKGKVLSEAQVLNLLSSSSKNERKNAAEVFGKTLKDNIFNFSFIINTISKDLDIEKNVRGFEHSESSRHLYNQIEKSDIDSLVKTATQNYSDICHRYYKYKAKYFGGVKLNYWDRNAPYPGLKEPKISWNEAKRIVVESYTCFDKRFGKIVEKFF